MKTRVFETHDRRFIPQAKFFLHLWQEITDDRYEHELRRADDYDTDFDARQSAEDCAVRFALNKGTYMGFVREPYSLLQKIRNYFAGETGAQGLPGPPGPQGPRGDRGESLRGLPGKDARGIDDLLCPFCGHHRTDPPAQRLLLEEATINVFLYNCNKCQKDSMWMNYNGLLLSERSIKRTPGRNGR
jgi:hypothetical protein